MCLIALFSTLPNCSCSQALQAPSSLPPSPPQQLRSCKILLLFGSCLQGQFLPGRAGKKLLSFICRCPLPYEFKPFFFFLLQKYQFPLPPSQPAKSPPDNHLIFCCTTSPCCNRSEPLIILIIFLAALPEGPSQAQSLVTIGACVCLETVLAPKRLQTVNQQYKLRTYTCVQGTFCTLPKGNQHPPETG